jgi:hypothetical protein
LQPADRALDFPALAVSPKNAAVLSRRFLSSFPMRRYQLNASLLQCVAKPVGVGRLVVQQIRRPFLCDARIHESFNRVDFSVLSGRGECRNRHTASLSQQHDLGSLSFFGLSHFKTPFFAGEKVPSPIACDQSKSFRRSIAAIRRRHAPTINPASVQALCRLQQVEGDGYRSGKSCHRAPFFRIQRMPSRQARGSTRGRPPSGDGSRSSNKSLIRFHCESLRNGFGAVLDPVVFGRRRCGHMDRVINMRASPFALTGMQIACH